MWFVGFELILNPKTPAFVKKGQTLELTCQSKEPEGLYGYYMIDVEGRRTELAVGVGSFKICEAYTNQTIFECHFEEIWTFKLILLNPIHNQTIECIKAYNRTSSSINTTIFVQGNTLVIATSGNYYSRHFHFTYNLLYFVKQISSFFITSHWLHIVAYKESLIKIILDNNSVPKL